MNTLTKPSAGYSLTLRLKISNVPGSLGRVTSKIGEVGGDIGAIDIAGVGKSHVIRDITVNVRDVEHGAELVAQIKKLDVAEVVNVSDRTFLMHLGGKIRINSKAPITTRDELSMAYTPGVGRVCTAIHEDPESVYKLTIKGNTIIVASVGATGPPRGS